MPKSVNNDEKTKFIIVTHAEKWSDIKLVFDNYDDAKKMFDKLSNSGKIQWKDIDKYDEYLKFGRGYKSPDLKDESEDDAISPNESDEIDDTISFTATNDDEKYINLEEKEF
jgi:hypothetical protein